MDAAGGGERRLLAPGPPGITHVRPTRRAGGAPMPSDDRRLEQLLSSYRTLRDQGRPASAVELCHDCPELIQTLQKRIDEFESAATLAPPEQASFSPPTLAPSPTKQPGESLATRPPHPEDARRDAQPARLPGYDVIEVL